ncbi:hypothetical protein EON64_06705 [archaeon]|nr:MAG: hypothetical protein EON64_06705 [archaeon]
MMKVTTAQGKSYEGDFYAVDPLTKALTLKGADDTFVVINSTHITSMTGNLGKAPDLSKFGVR